MSSNKFLLACMVALAAIQFSSSEISLVLTQNVVKSHKHTPDACHLTDDCGNMTTFYDALQAAKDDLIPDDPPFFSDGDARKSKVFHVDYHMCNYTILDDIWVTFPWGSHTQYVRLIDGIKYVRCELGMCDEHVFFGGWKYGCVATWRTRTFMALWHRRSGTPSKNICYGKWCLVNVKITYPEACKCAQLYPCFSPWGK